MAPQYTLSYFNIKGVAEPIRWIFEYAKVKYEDVRVAKEDWPRVKESSYALDSRAWSKMPVLDVDGVRIAQTNTIARFLALKFGIAGETDLEQAKCDEFLDVLSDMGVEFLKRRSEPDEGKKVELMKSLAEEYIPSHLGKFEAILKKNGSGFLVGKKLTYADIFVAYWEDALAENLGETSILGKLLALRKHSEMVKSQPGIKEWIVRRPVT